MCLRTNLSVEDPKGLDYSIPYASLNYRSLENLSKVLFKEELCGSLMSIYTPGPMLSIFSRVLLQSLSSYELKGALGRDGSSFISTCLSILATFSFESYLK